jgi:hypothetical protein
VTTTSRNEAPLNRQMTHWSYLTRVVDGELTRRLAANGAVLIEGPKACGKSETARRQAASEVLLDIDLAAREAAAIDPGLVLSGRLGEGSTGQCCL